MRIPVTLLLAAICLFGLVSFATAQTRPQMNEIVRNDISTDDHEFVEICAEPGTDLTGYAIIEIEGDADSTPGVIDKVIRLTGIVGASGYYTVGQTAVTCADQVEVLNIENGGITILLVSSFTGTVGQDIDLGIDSEGSLGISISSHGLGVGVSAR